MYIIVYWHNFASNLGEFNVSIADYENGVIAIGICKVHFNCLSVICVEALRELLRYYNQFNFGTACGY